MVNPIKTKEMTCTVFENIWHKGEDTAKGHSKPHYVSVDRMLERIKIGKSKVKVEAIRAALDKDKADLLKQNLPCVCFSGKFEKRFDENLIEHSGFLVLDFDEVNYIDEKIVEIISLPYVYAAWLSPRGNGIKALVKIADGNKHREHFAALLEEFPLIGEDGKQMFKLSKNGDRRPLYEIDRSGVNPSRVCYESYDPNIYINKEAEAYTKIKIVEQIELRETINESAAIFHKLLTWLSNRNDAFVSGERNFFIFKLGAACCRFGIDEDEAITLILREYPCSSDFTDKEARAAIKSAYRSNKNLAGSAKFEKDLLIDKVTRKEVQIKDEDIYDEDIRPRDVVYGQDVKGQALDIYNDGYSFVSPVGIPELDDLFKMRRAEITLLSGIGNYGKSNFKKWYQVLRAVLYGEKFASFPPEDYPIHNYYHELTEILLGCDCTPRNDERPSMSIYSRAYDFISSHFFYINPTDLAPTPEYIKQRFLELLIKEKIDGCDIDPFNQMTNDYGKHGGRSDKYLETVLSDFLRFAQQNNVFFWIVAHPVKMQLSENKNYPCPNVFDIADGAMWNNKMNNILIYHRPFMQVDPKNPACEFHTKKIKDQKSTGKKGFISFEFDRTKRRYTFSGSDPLERIIQEKGEFY
jgi:hypothetical protein